MLMRQRKTAPFAADEVTIAESARETGSVKWVVSEAGNFAQLRFDTRVQGGPCLRPGWEENALGASPVTSSPGALPHTRYIHLLAAGILVQSDPSVRERPSILMAGLGSGVGATALAHQFPGSEIDVVEIDPAVIDTALANYPLLAEGTRRITTVRDGSARPQIRLLLSDAAVFVAEYTARPYDVVVIDVRCADGSMPGQIFSEEFLSAVRAKVLRADGVVVCNCPASVTGNRKDEFLQVLRVLYAAGFRNVRNLPVLEGSWDVYDSAQGRNNVLLASEMDLNPDRNPDAWERLCGYTPFADYATGEAVTSTVAVCNGDGLLSTVAAVDTLDRASEVRAAIRDQGEDTAYGKRLDSSEASVLRTVSNGDSARAVLCEEIDWVRFGRWVWASAVAEGRLARQCGRELCALIESGEPSWNARGSANG